MEPALPRVYTCLRYLRLAVLPFAILLLLDTSLRGQSMYLPQDNKHLQFLQRLEILLQKNPDLNITAPKSVSRQVAVVVAGLEDSSSGNPHIRLSRVDQANLQSLLRNNAELVNRENSNKRTFYRNPANLAEINHENFFFALNPIIYGDYGYEKDSTQAVYHYAGGLGFRGMIGKNFGFYGSGVRHAESPPSFTREWIAAYNAVPGAGKLETYNDAYLYWDVRGGVTLKALRFFDFQIAYDRNFIGNGYRSLFLSDFAKNYVFGKATTRVWKFQYTHIYAPLIPQFETVRETNWPVGRRVTAFHHLSFNATKWLNVALFQSISIARSGDWAYMAPIIFYPVSSVKESKPQNNLGGFEFKANIAKKHQLYGQLIVDNVNLKELSKGNGWWNNRFGVQLGVKTINLFGIDNLDLQIEMNAVRPFTYSEDSLGSYTHYNQPLAHPLGANFFEGIAILNYQPSKKINIQLLTGYWKQGSDTSNLNFGSNVRLNPGLRPFQFGYTIPSGVEEMVLNTQLRVRYELFENCALIFSATYREKTSESKVLSSKNLLLGSVGFRLNLSDKEFLY